MKFLRIDYHYYEFPQNISSIDEFASYASQNYNSFIPLIQYRMDNCTFPYFIAEETEKVYLNVANIRQIYSEEATIIPTRKEYDDRLNLIIQKKCIHCKHYEEDADGENLSGHREKITLDGECFMFEKKNNLD